MTFASRLRRALVLLAACLLGATAAPLSADDGATAQVMEDLLDLSLEDLLQVKISTAAKYEQLAADAPASVTLITAEDLQRYGYRSLAEVLRHAAGFYLSDDRNYTYLGVRGFSRPSDYNNRVLLLLDGHPLNESIFGQALIGNETALPMNRVEQIEVVRGPGSALYGSYAMFAVVNVVTRKGGAAPEAHLAVEGGSWGRREGSASFSGPLAAGIQLQAGGRWGAIAGQDFFYREYADPDSAAGYSRDSDKERYRSFFARLDWRRLTIEGLHTWRQKHIPTGAYETLLDDARTWSRDSHNFVEARFDQPLGSQRRLVLRTYLDDAPYQGSYLYPDFLQLDETQNRAVGGEAQFHTALPHGNRLVAGGEVRRDFRASYYEYTASGVDFDHNYPFHRYSLYLQDRWDLTPALAAVLGLRHDRPSIAPSSTAPRIALLWHPVAGTGVKLLYGEAFRTPGVWESKIEDENLGFLANPGLTPEEIHTTEVVWEQRLGRRLLQTVSLYEYRVEGLIDQVQVGDNLYQYRNTSGARARGMEVQLEARQADGAQGYMRYALQRAEALDKGARLSNSPAHQLRLGGASPLGRYLMASVQILGESRRLTLRGSHTRAYWQTDLHLSLLPPRVLPAWGGRPRLVLLAHNLFNTSYAAPVGLELRQPTIAQDGCSLALRLESAW
ncbi:MAG: TonB-dependent receptor [Candidatus Latescibacteria bacterium]|nr:TonB-dependent receptor [Candidatus Latescibacterota bacterium]